MRTCTPRFGISQTARPIVFKFGVWVSSHYQSISCFVKFRYLSYRFRSTVCPKSNPIHKIFTNCAPFPIQSIRFSPIVPHFHPFPLHIHFHMDFHSTEGLYCRGHARRTGPLRAPGIRKVSQKYRGRCHM